MTQTGDKVIIVTGANGSIGRVLAEELLREGHKVVMACRDLEKGEKVYREIVAATGCDSLLLLSLDLVSYASIRRFVEELRRRGLCPSRLINNAGVMVPSYRTTEDGMELTRAVNYRGTVRLIHELRPLMPYGSVIVNTVSLTWLFGRSWWRQGSGSVKWPYSRLGAYSDSKLALFVYTAWLSKQLLKEGISVHAVDPGIVDTEMITMHRWFDPLTDRLFRPLIRSPFQGALPALRAVSADCFTGLLFKGGAECPFPARIRRLSGKFSMDDVERLL